MKKIIGIMFLSLIVSCATNKSVEQVVAQQEIIEDTIKEDKIIGDDLPSWTRKSGIENGMVFAVGKAEFDANKSEYYIERAAAMDGEIKLLTDAPTDVRVLTQNALTGAGIDGSEFYQIQTKLQEVVGLTGIRHSEDKVACRKVIRYGELSSRLTRSCWVQVSIPVKELVAAYRRTLALKFGEYKANEFKDLMMDELNNIKNNPLIKKEISHESDSQEHSSANDNVSNRNVGQSLRLPASESKARFDRQQLHSEDSSPSRVQSGGSDAQADSTKQRLSPALEDGGNEKANDLLVQRGKKIGDQFRR